MLAAPTLPPPAPWYVCQRCGNCCRWPGFVKLEDGEAEKIAAHLGLDLYSFTERYCELMPTRTALSLISKPNHECIFLEDNICQIQAVKPVQCKRFPNGWNFPGWRQACEAIETAS